MIDRINARLAQAKKLSAEERAWLTDRAGEIIDELGGGDNYRVLVRQITEHK